MGRRFAPVRNPWRNVYHLVQEYIEPPEFRGLLFFDGLDSLGRPVVIVNADAMGENKGARKNAFQYIVQILEPIVVQVHPPSQHDISQCPRLLLRDTCCVAASPSS